MTDQEVIAGILQREGRFRPAVKRPDSTWDAATMFGITAPTYGEWKGYGRPATVAELKAMPIADAHAIYSKRYILDPGFTAAAIPFEPLRAQLVDFGVNSGPTRAVRWLQRVLAVPVTGLLDARTRTALTAYPGRLINDALVAARLYMIDRTVDTGGMRREDEEGVESRALTFFLSRPEAG